MAVFLWKSGFGVRTRPYLNPNIDIFGTVVRCKRAVCCLNFGSRKSKSSFRPFSKTRNIIIIIIILILLFIF